MVSRMVAAGLLGSLLLAPEVAVATTPALPTEPVSIGLSPASPRAGSEVRLTGGAGAAGYVWDLDGDGQFDDATGKEVTASFTAGPRTVRAQAVTALGLLTDSRTFTVHGWNATPTGTISLAPYTARAGAPVTVTAKGGDPDGRSVQTDLDLDGDGSFETAGATGTATFATAGERTIRARFTDDAGATSVTTATLDVHTGNLAPTARIDRYISLDGRGGWRVDAADADGEIVRYEFDLDGDGSFETDRGRDADVPDGATAFRVRVTDDAGAVAVHQRSVALEPPQVPAVVQVGVPTQLSLPGHVGVEWDADGDGAFDDGAGNSIAFTYAAAGTYDVRARLSGGSEVRFTTTSVRDAADIAVPRAHWQLAVPTRPAYLQYGASGPTGAEWNVDLDGDGAFDDAPPNSFSTRWAFSGPATVALRAADARGRTAVTTLQVPFVPGNLGPDATMFTFDTKDPLKAAYPRASLTSSMLDGDGSVTQAWDADGDGQYDDGDVLGSQGNVAASFGLLVTDDGGATTTLRRSLEPIVPQVRDDTTVPPPWLQVVPRAPRLATLLRRGMTVDVKCTRPQCRTKLVAKVDAKTARKLGLRSRTVATRTVSGTRRVSLKLTAKARKALKSVRSVKLTLTAQATAQGGVRGSWTTTVTIRKQR